MAPPQVNAPPLPAAQADSPAFGALPSPLDAVDDVRSTAKWTIAAFAAVGSALISGGPLVAIGKVHGTAHIIIAGLGLAAVLAGVCVAIWQTSNVLTPFITTPATVLRLTDLTTLIDASPEEFFGSAATSVRNLVMHRRAMAQLQRALTAETDQAIRQTLAQNLARAQRNVARTDPYVRWLLAFAHVWQVQQALRRARRWTVAGGVLVVAGAVALLAVSSGSSASTPARSSLVPVHAARVQATPAVPSR